MKPNKNKSKQMNKIANSIHNTKQKAQGKYFSKIENKN